MKTVESISTVETLSIAKASRGIVPALLNPNSQQRCNNSSGFNQLEDNPCCCNAQQPVQPGRLESDSGDQSNRKNHEKPSERHQDPTQSIHLNAKQRNQPLWTSDKPANKRP